MRRIFLLLIGDFEDIDVGVTGECFRKYMRIKVAISVSRPLKRFLLMELKKGKETILLLRYERLPEYCFHCGLIGHSYQECRDKKEDGRKGDTEDESDNWRNKENAPVRGATQHRLPDGGGVNLTSERDVGTNYINRGVHGIRNTELEGDISGQEFVDSLNNGVVVSDANPTKVDMGAMTDVLHGDVVDVNNCNMGTIGMVGKVGVHIRNVYDGSVESSSDHVVVEAITRGRWKRLAREGRRKVDISDGVGLLGKRGMVDLTSGGLKSYGKK
ncbi:hypothetical protein Ddye_009823 [Dipteronia dyeriana]|uniref:CCHC-type domain-containing protein n=1 Tax=Dipteronia dyeriana TaxID=168575 RepID=A0AAE0CMP6_9ROSI|nr:hypothetical protein Ddye_009823 [Dipteronia dyeriana]